MIRSTSVKVENRILNLQPSQPFKKNDLVYDQVPLAVPCYDLLPLTEPSLIPPCGGAWAIPSSLELTGDCPLET